jgi:hypothetical protein
MRDLQRTDPLLEVPRIVNRNHDHLYALDLRTVRKATMETPGAKGSLDLTHVLCQAVYEYLRNSGLNPLADDESSYTSLALALVTLSPILLMVSYTLY